MNKNLYFKNLGIKNINLDDNYKHIIKNNLLFEKNKNNKPTLILYIHYGFGDLLNMSGAVRFLSEENQVIVTVKNINIENAKILFNDINDIGFLIIEDNLYYNDKKNTFDKINILFDKVLLSGIHNRCDLTNFPISFYNDINIDSNIMTNYFRKKEIKYSNIDIDILNDKNIKYIFVHAHSSDKILNINFLDKLIDKILIICPNKNYNLENSNNNFFEIANKFINLPFFYYTSIIENAEELYVIDSSFYCYCLYLKLKAKIKNCYYRDGNGYNYLNNEFKYVRLEN
jgi:hypothetical protein